MTASLDWVKKVEEAIWQLEERPQFGTLPPFPFDALTESLAKTFSRPSLTLQSIGQGWMESQEALKGFSQDHLTLKFTLSPISTPLYFSIGERDLKWLFANLAGGKEEEAFSIEDKSGRGFLSFLALSIFQQIEKLKWLPNLSFQIDHTPFSLEKEIGDNPSFVFDIGAMVDEKSLWARLFITSEFRSAFKRHYALFEPHTLDLEKVKFPLELACGIGGSTISLEEFKKVKVGDFILLDRSHFDMETKKGRIILSLGSTPLFRGKLEEGGIRLLEFPQYEEVMVMEEKSENEREDESFFESEEEEGELFEDEQLEEESSDVEKKEKSEEKKASHVSPEDIPLQLTVELARIGMKASDLMNLSAGDLVELNLYPESGVNLMIQGKKVGRGELVKMEDLLFVRVLEL